MIDLVTVAALTAASVPAALRWLRILQREHYLAGSATRFAMRWWGSTPGSLVLAGAAVAASVSAWWWPAAGLIVAVVQAGGPVGLGVRGHTAPLTWTPRLRRVGVGVAIAIAIAVAAGLAVTPAITALAVVCLPALVDLIAAANGPLERRLSQPWVTRAAVALKESEAVVVAITGSYGKTSTKNHVAHLLGGVRRTMASPASFNNRMGLARAVNEHLTPGVEVFVAEMGTYGRGEIADLCSWIRPDVAVITAIGPVHLERFGSEERIVEAKREILDHASVVVLNVDDNRLAALANAEDGRRRVIRVGSSEGLDVYVSSEGEVSIRSEGVGTAPSQVHPGNLACALGVVLALDVDPRAISGRIDGLTEPDHRRTVATGATGVVIVDDTFNANPAGAAAALTTLVSCDVAGRRVVVTPGMVELGASQHTENARFSAAAAAVADHLIVVGRTNRRSLLEGADGGRATVTAVGSRDEAVDWVRSNLGDGDAVLYENDLPDHYP
ncbi:hypothetical protein BH23ACT5_BH23ACT5_20760 [soil metagenome]